MKKTIPALLTCVLIGASLCAAAQKNKPVLNHIAVSVSDLRSSTAFYQHVIGLDTIPEPFHDGKHTWFSVSEHSHLHLIEAVTNKTEQNINSHLCFSVPSVEDVIAALQKQKIAYRDWAGKPSSITTRVDGVKQIYFQDPDGYWIEINNDYPKAK